MLCGIWESGTRKQNGHYQSVKKAHDIGVEFSVANSLQTAYFPNVPAVVSSSDTLTGGPYWASRQQYSNANLKWLEFTLTVSAALNLKNNATAVITDPADISAVASFVLKIDGTTINVSATSSLLYAGDSAGVSVKVTGNTQEPTIVNQYNFIYLIDIGGIKSRLMVSANPTYYNTRNLPSTLVRVVLSLPFEGTTAPGNSGLTSYSIAGNDSVKRIYIIPIKSYDISAYFESLSYIGTGAGIDTSNRVLASVGGLVSDGYTNPY